MSDGCRDPLAPVARVGVCFASFTFVVNATSLLSLQWPQLAVFVAVLPAATLTFIIHRSASDADLGRLMMRSFVEAIALMLPLAAMFLIWSASLAAFSPAAAFTGLGDTAAVSFGGMGIGSVLLSITAEEMLKCTVAWRRARTCGSVHSLALCGAAAACGFAAAENVLYMRLGGLSTTFLRAFTAVPLHCASGAIVGLRVGKKSRLPIVEPIAWHALYNAAVVGSRQWSSGGGPGGGIPGLVAVLAAAAACTRACSLVSRLPVLPEYLEPAKENS